MTATSLTSPAPAGLVAGFFVRPGALLLRSMFPLIGEDSPRVWADVAYEGRWEGHPSGAFELTRDDFESCVRNFEAQQNPVPLDWEHATEFALEAPAAGWVHELEVRDDENGVAHLWAHVELGQKAAGQVKAGEYRFTSGVFVFHSIDRVSGEDVGTELTSLALTGRPFIDGQTPLTLSRRRAAAGADMNDDKVTLSNATELAALFQLLGVDETALTDVDRANPLGVVFREIEALKALGVEPEIDVEVTAPEGGEAPAMAASADTNDAGVALAGAEEIDMLAQSLMEKLGMSEEELLAALQKLAEGGDGEAEGEGEPMAQAPALSARVRAQDETIRALSKRLEGAEGQLKSYREREADEAVGVLVDSGRLLDTGREFARGLFLSNRGEFERMAAALPEVVPVGSHSAGAEPPTQGAPAIDDSDPDVARLRRMLTAAKLNRAQQDEAIRKSLAARKGNETRV